MFSLLDVLTVYDLIFESVTQCVGQLNKYLAVFGNYNNMAARFEDSEKSQIYQDFIKHFHVVDKIYLESKIFLIYIVNFRESFSYEIEFQGSSQGEEYNFTSLLQFLAPNEVSLAQASVLRCHKRCSIILFFYDFLNLIIIEEELVFDDLFAALHFDKVRDS
jgi:hypothetical protein